MNYDWTTFAILDIESKSNGYLELSLRQVAPNGQPIFVTLIWDPPEDPMVVH